MKFNLITLRSNCDTQDYIIHKTFQQCNLGFWSFSITTTKEKKRIEKERGELLEHDTSAPLRNFSLYHNTVEDTIPGPEWKDSFSIYK